MRLDQKNAQLDAEIAQIKASTEQSKASTEQIKASTEQSKATTAQMKADLEQIKASLAEKNGTVEAYDESNGMKSELLALMNQFIESKTEDERKVIRSNVNSLAIKIAAFEAKNLNKTRVANFDNTFRIIQERFGIVVVRAKAPTVSSL